MIHVNPNLRILTRAAGATAYLVGQSKAFDLSDDAVSFLIDMHLAKNKGTEPYQLLKVASSHLINRLLENSILIETKPTEWIRDTSTDTRLASWNWSKARDYMRLTLDYPFFDYSKNGWAQDSKMMSDYLTVECEIPRSKCETDRDCSPSEENWENAIGDLCDGGKKDVAKDIRNAVIVTLGARGKRKLSNGEPVLRKSVPSGGARHPTEAYLLDLRSGNAFHFDPVAMTFFGVKTFESSHLYKTAFCEPLVYVTFPVSMCVVFTSVWERNMFRYREPRTFRSVHLDAGHASGCVELLMHKLKYHYHVQYNTRCEVLEELLGIDPLVEGVMSTIMIGPRRDCD